MTRVLVVEDDEWLAEQLQRSLARENYEVKLAPNILEAIEAIDDFQPDVLLMDVLLPGGTAFSLLAELQSYGDTGKIPVVLCTNLADDIALENVKPYGVKRILDKAVMHPADVAAAIRSVL